MIKKNIQWSLKQIIIMIRKNKILFNNVFQRSYVWERSRQSRLIHSFLEDYPVPALYAVCKGEGKDKVYDMLDGKQRLEAVRAYMNDEFALINVPPVHADNENLEEEEYDVNGKLFSQLPENLQDILNGRTLTLYFYDDITYGQIQRMFANLNNGKPLSTKAKNIANCIDLRNISEIGKHDLFGEILTEKAKEDRKHLPMVMKIWMMLNYDIDDVSFESRDFNEVMENTKFTEDESREVVDILNRYYSIYKTVENLEDKKAAKKIMGKMKMETHLVSLIPFVKKAKEEDIDSDLMASFMENLFSGDTIVSGEYMDACKNGSAKSANIRRRHDEIEKRWEEFFAE